MGSVSASPCLRNSSEPRGHLGGRAGNATGMVLQESDRWSEIWDPSVPSSMAKAGKQWHKLR